MSSHHIIREKQEPALLILDNSGFSSELLGQLLEWSPTVFVTGANYEEVDSLGIKIDGIVAPPDFSVSQPSIRHVPQKTIALQDAILFLCDDDYRAVNVIDSSFDPAAYLSLISLINIVVYTPVKKIFPVSSGFSKWKASGEEIELLNIPSSLELTGLKQVSGSRFETTHDGFYLLRFGSGQLFVSEDI